jgi:hypothetical protein
MLSFVNDDGGAITVDWVVLTAAIVGIAVIAVINIQRGTDFMSDQLGTFLAEQDQDELRNPNR